MKTLLLALLALALPMVAHAAVSPTAMPANVTEDLLKYGPFGNVLVYHTPTPPKNVVLFISGDGGFDTPFINMVKTISKPDTMVVAIDINTYLKNMAKQKSICMYAAADLEGLSQFIQTHYNYSRYISPVIAGYSSGATMGYTSLVQGPPNTFAGVIAMGFCSDMTSPKPFCKGAGLTNVEGGEKEPTAPKSYKNYIYGRVSSTVAPFFALQGAKDHLCSATDAATFITGTQNASEVSITNVDHGFLKGEQWDADFEKAMSTITARQQQSDATLIKPQSLSDLPLIESGVTNPKGKPLAVIVTGDGGWAGIDREIGGALNAEGINVVGLNSLQYFWKAKNPEIGGKDLSRILAWYQAAWAPPYVILVGYSRGAENIPFMANRLPDSQKATVRTIAILGPERKASFAFHVSDWLLSGSGADDLPIKPEADKMPGTSRLCFYGADETADSLCPTLNPAQFTIIKTPGGHHFGGDYKKLADQILAKTTAH